MVLLHHGFAGCEMWRGLLPHIVMAGYRVVMYDRRGYGKSDPGPDLAAYYQDEGFRDAAVAELAGLMDRLGLDHAHLVGQCEGGVVALDMARAHAGRAASLVMASTQCYSPSPMREFNRSCFPARFGELDEKIQQKMIAWHGAEHAAERYELYSWMGGSYGCDWFDLRPLLPSVSQPALVLYPDRSALFPVEQAMALYEGLPSGELAVIPSCGHNTYENKPQEYLRILLDFLRRRQGGEDPSRHTFGFTCAG